MISEETPVNRPKASKVKRIILVDDDTELAEIMKVILEQENYEVFYASEGLELEKQLTERMPDLLIIDYLMPKKNGAQIVSEVKKNKKLRKLKIIMIAANPAYKKEGIRVGVNEFLEKPFDIEKLLKVIKKNIS